jgi:hypothetical protein
MVNFHWCECTSNSGGSSDQGARGRPCKVGSSLTLMQSGLPKTVPIGGPLGPP